MEVDDSLPTILWKNYFFDAKEYTVEQNLVYEDNQSSILIEKNGKASCLKRMRHIKIRYFFLKDKFDKSEVNIQHRPNKEMWSDILTKPKQSSHFRKKRVMLMNLEEHYDDGDDPEENNPVKKNSKMEK